jgi:hypothetical protein
MSKRRKPAKQLSKTKARPPGGEATDLAPFTVPDISESQVFTGNQSLHELFQQQVRQTLDQSDLDEDAKQAILVAMNCPCCGVGGMNYTVPLKRRT